MKHLIRFVTGVALVTCATVSPSVMAQEVSYNVGWASEYYFRGILQKTSSASAGIDFEYSGLYAGAWTADVGQGLEYDLYAGYGMDFTDMISGSIGYTGYFYTDEGFDDTYQEVNLGLGISFLSLEYSFGEWDGFGTPVDYDFFAATVDYEGFYGTFGTFGDETDGDYLEIGYGFSVADEIDLGISAIFNSEELSDQTDGGPTPEPGQAVIFTIGKSW